MSTILPEEEIDRLTKPRTQRAAQTRFLEKLLGCKLARRPDGLPLVTTEMLSRLNGGDQPKTETSNGLNWGT